jgi:dynein heavy chain 2, cytosolic
MLIKEWRDAITEVGDQQRLVASLRHSPYFVMFQDQIDGWDKRFGTLQEGLSMMSSVQRKWLYLEPIFARGALVEYAQQFRQVWCDKAGCRHFCMPAPPSSPECDDNPATSLWH